jgi:hypothetical protein
MLYNKQTYWSGKYYSGDSFVKSYLYISTDSQYIYNVRGCLGIYFSSFGKIEVENDFISFIKEHKLPFRSHSHLFKNKKYKLIEINDYVFLIQKDSVSNFLKSDTSMKSVWDFRKYKGEWIIKSTKNKQNKSHFNIIKTIDDSIDVYLHYVIPFIERKNIINDFLKDNEEFYETIYRNSDLTLYPDSNTDELIKKIEKSCRRIKFVKTPLDCTKPQKYLMAQRRANFIGDVIERNKKTTEEEYIIKSNRYGRINYFKEVGIPIYEYVIRNDKVIGITYFMKDNAFYVKSCNEFDL